MKPAPSAHRSKPRFDPKPKKTLFDWILWPLKAVLGSYVALFSLLVVAIIVLAFSHFSRPNVYELEVHGLPSDIAFVALVNEDEPGLLRHNFPFKRLGGTVDRLQRAVESRASYVRTEKNGDVHLLPLFDHPELAQVVLVRRADGRFQRTEIRNLEGGWGSWRLDLGDSVWRDCDPTFLQHFDIGAIDARPVQADRRPR